MKQKQRYIELPESWDELTEADTVSIGNNEAVMIEELEVDTGNRIRISIRNMSDELTRENVYYTIECFDMEKIEA